MSNLRFAQAVEPHNPEVNARLAQVTEWRERGQISLPSNLALERATNPFLRAEVANVVAKSTNGTARLSARLTRYLLACGPGKTSFKSIAA